MSIGSVVAIGRILCCLSLFFGVQNVGAQAASWGDFFAQQSERVISVPAGLSYQDQKVAVHVVAPMPCLVDIDLVDRGSGAPEDVFTPLPHGKIQIRFLSDGKAPQVHGGNSALQIPLVLMYNELYKAFSAYQKHEGSLFDYTLSPMQLYMMKVFLLMKDVYDLSMAHVQKELIRLTCRLSLSSSYLQAASLKSYLPEHFFHSINSMVPGAGDFIEDIWSDLHSGSYDVIGFAGGLSTSRIMKIFVFHDAERAAQAYNLFEKNHDRKLDRLLLDWIVQQKYSVETTSAEMLAAVSVQGQGYVDIWNGKKECLAGLEQQQQDFMRKSVFVREGAFADLSADDQALVERNAFQYDAALVKSEKSDGTVWLICCTDTMDMRGSLRASMRLLFDLFHRYIDLRKHDESRAVVVERLPQDCIASIPYGKELLDRVEQKLHNSPPYEHYVDALKIKAQSCAHELTELKHAEASCPRACLASFQATIAEAQKKCADIDEEIAFLDRQDKRDDQSPVDYQAHIKELLSVLRADNHNEDRDQVRGLISQLQDGMNKGIDFLEPLARDVQHVYVRLQYEIDVYAQTDCEIRDYCQKLDREEVEQGDPLLRQTKKMIHGSYKKRLLAYADYLVRRTQELQRDAAALFNFGKLYEAYRLVRPIDDGSHAAPNYSRELIVARDMAVRIVNAQPGTMNSMVTSLCKDVGITSFLEALQDDQDSRYAPLRHHMKGVLAWIIDHSAHMKKNMVVYRYFIDMIFPMGMTIPGVAGKGA